MLRSIFLLTRGLKRDSQKECKLLHGKNALITGSTQGIGLAIAQVLAKKGCNILVHGFQSTEKGQSIIQKLKEHGGNVAYYKADLREDKDIKELIKCAVQFLNGRIDILVNNAGVQHVSPLEDFPVDKWNEVIAVNLTAPFLMTKAVVPVMKNFNYGRIINIASAHGQVASINKSAYIASKHGIVGFTKATAGTGITVNCICPGWVRTDLVEKQIHALALEKGILIEDAALEIVKEKHPTKQFVLTDQVAECVAFLCSPNASQITGSSLTIDGGWVAQ